MAEGCWSQEKRTLWYLLWVGSSQDNLRARWPDSLCDITSLRLEIRELERSDRIFRSTLRTVLAGLVAEITVWFSPDPLADCFESRLKVKRGCLTLRGVRPFPGVEPGANSSDLPPWYMKLSSQDDLLSKDFFYKANNLLYDSKFKFKKSTD